MFTRLPDSPSHSTDPDAEPRQGPASKVGEGPYSHYPDLGPDPISLPSCVGVVVAETLTSVDRSSPHPSERHPEGVVRV